MNKRNYSSKRNAVYNAVLSTDTHPSARNIYEKLKPDYPDLSISTVYRNIALFKSEGKINVVCSVNGEERIDAKLTPHPHFVCSVCGNVYDVKETAASSDYRAALADDNYKVESRFVIYYGKCPSCG